MQKIGKPIFFQYKLKTTEQLHILYKILENVAGNYNIYNKAFLRQLTINQVITSLL